MRLNECLNESSPKAGKVTLVAWNASFGGIERIIVDYLKYLGDDIDFTVYSLRRVNPEVNLFAKYTMNLRCGHKRNLILYVKFLLYALQNRNQVFHLFNAGPMVLLILRLASVRKIIYHIHGTIYWKKYIEKISNKISWYLALYGSNRMYNVQFLANSEFSKKRFLEQISPVVRIEVLYNAFDPLKFKPVKKSPDPQLKIFYIGRLVPGKNLFLWLDAAEHILKYFPKTRFKIVGDGNLKNGLLKQIKEKGLEKHIEITGYIDEVEKVYQDNDLLLFLSEFESFGNVIVESVLTQTPVIASAIPSLKEICKDYPEFLVPLDNHFFGSLMDRLNHYDLLMESVTRARQDFIRIFNLENHIHIMKNFYNNNPKKEIPGEK